MKINGYHHIGLLVQDMDKSLDFYLKGLGGKTVHTFPMGDSGKTIHLVDLGGNAVIELIPRGEGKEEQDAHWAHICLNADDVKAAYAQAIAAGAVSRSEPHEGKLGSMAMSNAFVLGPDDEVIEFFTVY
ncbi:MAG: VOC family protein [Christensenellaceae bacterium]|nr:VOC family protein [Christensenellaceae bacterium]